MEADEFQRAVVLGFFFNLALLWAWNFRMTFGRGRRQRFADFRRNAALLPIIALVYLALLAWKPTDPEGTQRIQALVVGSVMAYALLWLLPRGVWLRLPLLRLED